LINWSLARNTKIPNSQTGLCKTRKPSKMEKVKKNIVPFAWGSIIVVCRYDDW